MPPARIAFFDLDGTLVVGQTQQLFVSFLRSRGEVALPYLVGVGLWFAAYKLGWVHPSDRLRERGAVLLKGRTVAEAAAVMDEFVEGVLAPRLHAGAAGALADHRSAGDRVVILSAALEPLVQALARRLDVTEWVATPVEVVDDRFTGRLAGAALYGGQKVVAAQRILRESGVDAAECFAYADHETDIDLLEMVGRPVAVRPKPALLARAQSQGWLVLP